MPALVKYALLSAADLMIIGVLVHYFLAMLHWYTPPFEQPYRDRYRTPTRVEKLKKYSYFAVLFVGTFLALYGALSFLFSWMPHRWGTFDDDGEWTTTAHGLSMLGAFVGMFTLLFGLEKTVEKVSEISELKLRQSKSEAFCKLLQREVGHFGRMLAYPETAAADHLARVEQEIEEAEKSGTVYYEDARICRDLVGTLRRAMTEERR
jgi:hypothetical protein